MLVVAADSPASSVADLVNWMKGHPGESSYGAVGSGSPTHLIFARRTDTSAVQVLYKGGAAAMPDLMSGRLTYMIQPAGEVIPHIASGRLKALAVTGLERSVDLPAVPTFAEAGVPDLVLTGWWGIFAPAGTPQPIVNRLSSDLGAVLERDDVRSGLHEAGVGGGLAEHREVCGFLS